MELYEMLNKEQLIDILKKAERREKALKQFLNRFPVHFGFEMSPDKAGLRLVVSGVRIRTEDELLNNPLYHQTQKFLTSEDVNNTKFDLIRYTQKDMVLEVLDSMQEKGGLFDIT